MTPHERSNTGNRGVSALTEREGVHGWKFEMGLPGEIAEGGGGGAAAGAGRTLTLLLSWVDYEYWSHGAASPCRVAEAVLRSVLEADPARELPESFDASTARRWVKDLDRRVREML